MLAILLLAVGCNNFHYQIHKGHVLHLHAGATQFARNKIMLDHAFVLRDTLGTHMRDVDLNAQSILTVALIEYVNRINVKIHVLALAEETLNVKQ